MEKKINKFYLCSLIIDITQLSIKYVIELVLATRMVKMRRKLVLKPGLKIKIIRNNKILMFLFQASRKNSTSNCCTTNKNSTGIVESRAC